MDLDIFYRHYPAVEADVQAALDESLSPRGPDLPVAAAGLRVDQRIEPGSEWGEYAEEHSANAPGRKLLHAARLLRDPELYVQRFGRATYDIALGDCLWHVYRMLGKLAPRVYVLSVA